MKLMLKKNMSTSAPSNSWYLRREKDRWYSIPSLSCLPQRIHPSPSRAFSLPDVSKKQLWMSSNVDDSCGEFRVELSFSIEARQLSIPLFWIIIRTWQSTIPCIHRGHQSMGFQYFFGMRPSTFPVSNVTVDPRHSKTAWHLNLTSGFRAIVLTQLTYPVGFVWK